MCRPGTQRGGSPLAVPLGRIKPGLSVSEDSVSGRSGCGHCRLVSHPHGGKALCSGGGVAYHRSGQSLLDDTELLAVSENVSVEFAQYSGWDFLAPGVLATT